MIKEEFNRAPVLHLLLRYTQALITQMAQTAVCNRHHSLDQQLCRWLLLSLDRLQGNELVMTQELIANMLGVRREGVTEGAVKLQKAGLIQYARGHITVLDRPGSKGAPASATPWSRRNTTGCFRTGSPSSRAKRRGCASGAMRVAVHAVPSARRVRGFLSMLKISLRSDPLWLVCRLCRTADRDDAKFCALGWWRPPVREDVAGGKVPSVADGNAQEGARQWLRAEVAEASEQ